MYQCRYIMLQSYSKPKNVTQPSLERQGVRVIPTEDLQSLVGGGLAADEARFDFRLLGPSETHGQDMQGEGLPLPGGARRQTRGYMRERLLIRDIHGILGS